MNPRQVSPQQLKRFVRHLCRVASHYHNREHARKGVDSQMQKLKKATAADKELIALNDKINKLVEKESAVAELGSMKRAPSSLHYRMRSLEAQLNAAAKERDALTLENKKLREALDSVGDITSHIRDHKEETKKRVQKIESDVDTEYRTFMIDDIKEKIGLLEDQYKVLSKDKTISPARLFKIKEKLNEYKKKVKKLRS